MPVPFELEQILHANAFGQIAALQFRAVALVVAAVIHKLVHRDLLVGLLALRDVLVTGFDRWRKN